MNTERVVLIPYVTFAFVLGFAWFMLAPLVPSLGSELHTSLSSIVTFISFYGYAMVLGSLPAGLWAAKSGPKPVLIVSIILSVVGLLLRAFAHTYALFFIAQALASLAYPFLIAPIGSVLRMSGVTHLRRATGLTIGTLFFGMGVSALVGAHLPLATGLWLGFILNLLVGIWLWAALTKIRVEPAKIKVKVRLVYSNWWIVGFVVSSTSVMFGSITVPALGHLHIAHAEALGGLLSALTFLGSAAGAGLFGHIGESVQNPKTLIRVLAVLTWLSVAAVTLLLTGHLVNSNGIFDVIFFLTGVFGNGWYSLALEEAARRAQNAGSAGMNTAGFSMASNIGVAIIPAVLGPMVISQASSWIIITLLLMLIALVIPFSTRTQSAVDEDASLSS